MIVNFRERNTITEDEKDFILNKDPYIPVFYILPKVHKSMTNPPGRPIVAGVDSLTANLSMFIDHKLQPFMNKIDSYLKDTTDVLNLLEEIEWKDGYQLATADGSSLYTIIEEKKGVEAVMSFLEPSDMSKDLQEFVRKGIEFILNNNYFSFHGDFYIQLKGTAMGTRFTPCYANMFMAVWEKSAITVAEVNLVLWKRYVDDILLIWNGTKEELCETLNVNDRGINLTFNISEKEVDFLDLKIYIEKGEICTQNYVKPTDSNSYIPINSSHHRTWLRNIPKGQFLRVKGNCKNEQIGKIHMNKMKNQFLEKGYSCTDLERIIEEVDQIDRKSLLTSKIGSNKKNLREIPFISQFSGQHQEVEKIIKKHWGILKNDEKLTNHIGNKPRFIYRKSQSIKNQLVKSAFEIPKIGGEIKSK